MKYSMGIPVINTNRVIGTLDASKQVTAPICQTAVTVTHNGDGVIPATFSANISTVTSTSYVENDVVVLWTHCLVAYSSCTGCEYNKYD